MQLLITDDDENTLDFIANAFTMAWPEISIITATSGKQTIKSIETYKPDGMLLDLGLPDISGFEIIKRLRQESEIPIMVITARNEERDIVKALSLGANEYLVKPFGQLELVARVKAMMRGQHAGQDDTVVEYCSLRLDPNINELHNGEATIQLTNTEKQIMYQLLRAKGKIVKTHELVIRIYGTATSGGENGIKTHIYRLRQKIEKDSKHPQIIITKPGIGYCLGFKQS
jgi:DNA-binding response OmpR family regulator